MRIETLLLAAMTAYGQYVPQAGIPDYNGSGYTVPFVSGSVPIVNGLTVSVSQGSIGTTVDVCWNVGYYPTSVAVTTGITGTVSTYTDSVNPSLGCKTLTIAGNSRVRQWGDSIDCGFRTTNGVPCPAGGSPDAFLAKSISQLTTNSLVSIPSFSNLSVVGAVLQGKTPASCTGSGFYPDIAVVGYEVYAANADTDPTNYNAAISAWWASAKASGCIVVARSLTMLANAFDATLQPLQNAYIQANWQTSASALIDVGADPNMGCAICNQVGHIVPGVGLNPYFTTLDCTPTCPNGTTLTHWSDAGHLHVSNSLAILALLKVLRVPFSIVATNSHGSSAVTTIPGVLVLQ